MVECPKPSTCRKALPVLGLTGVRGGAVSRHPPGQEWRAYIPPSPLSSLALISFSYAPKTSPVGGQRERPLGGCKTQKSACQAQSRWWWERVGQPVLSQHKRQLMWLLWCFCDCYNKSLSLEELADLHPSQAKQPNNQGTQR